MRNSSHQHHMRTAHQDHFNSVVGRTVAKLREERGISQRHLAEEIGLSHQSVTAIESGRSVPAFTLARIAEALDVTLDELVPIDALMMGA